MIISLLKRVGVVCYQSAGFGLVAAAHGGRPKDSRLTPADRQRAAVQQHATRSYAYPAKGEA